MHICLTKMTCERCRASGIIRHTLKTVQFTTPHFTARQPAPIDLTPVPCPLPTSDIGVPGDTTVEKSQLRDMGV